MKLPDPIAIATIKVADWLDDRLTIAAIGMMTGYFGLTDVQWNSLGGVVIAIATALLVLIPDPRKRKIPNELPPIELVGRSDADDADGDCQPAAEQLRESLPTPPNPKSGGNHGGWNG